MDRFTPLWSRIVDSSLWMEEDWVVKVFITMLAKQDPDHVVRGTAYNIAIWAKKDEATVLKALKILSEPDKKRLEPQPYEGRRIERVEDGWFLLNGQHYQEMMTTLFRRAYKARKQAEYREAEKAVAKGAGKVKEKRRVFPAVPAAVDGGGGFPGGGVGVEPMEGVVVSVVGGQPAVVGGVGV